MQYEGVEVLTPMKAIRAKCLDCVCGNPNEVRLCPSKDCTLWPYRFGHNPSRKGTGGAGHPENFIKKSIKVSSEEV